MPRPMKLRVDFARIAAGMLYVQRHDDRAKDVGQDVAEHDPSPRSADGSRPRQIKILGL